MDNQYFNYGTDCFGSPKCFQKTNEEILECTVNKKIGRCQFVCYRNLEEQLDILWRLNDG